MKIAIVVTEGFQASSVHGIVDILLAARYAIKEYRQTATPGIQFKLVGLSKHETSYSNFGIGPLATPEEIFQPDVVIVPGAFESILTARQITRRMKRLKGWCSYLQAWQEKGAVIASACSGNFIVAESGLSRGRTMVCHWLTEKAAKEVYKNETFISERMLIDHGDLVSCGGAFSVSQLILYLLQRFVGRDIALATAKIMMIEPSFKTQTRFSAFVPSMSHDDKPVLLLQEAMEKNLDTGIQSKDVADQWGISDRQLCRRFKRITGETPISYLQKIRIEKSKTMLETTPKRNNQILLEVGYEDMSSFSRLFRRSTGMTMNEYRARFSVPLSV